MRVIARPWRGLAALALTALVTVVLIVRSCGVERAVEATVTMRAAGPPETVFDWSSEACASGEFPDLPVRAYRDYRGLVQLVLPRSTNWRLSGPDLNHLHNPCRVVMNSSRDTAPAKFNEREWIASVHTNDGRRIAALVHEEHHGRHPGTCIPTEPASCWYNSITFARSDNGGRSFEQPPPPRHLVAAATSRYRHGVPPTGIFTPSNIVRGRDGNYFALVVSRAPTGERGTCLIRSVDPFEPSSWRAWDGGGFGIAFADPYRVPPGAARPCVPVAKPQIATMHESLTLNTYLERYLLVGLASETKPSGERVTGIYFSLSGDLIHWSRRRLLMRATRLQTFRCGGPDPISYPSLIDPESRSRTFATTGRRPYLYYTRFNFEGCRQSFNRDLVRRPIELTK